MTATQPKELQHLVSMHLFVAFGAQGDQVLFLVATRSTSEFEMVYLEVLQATAGLASPTVALQHLAMQFTVAVRSESESRALTDLGKAAASAIWLEALPTIRPGTKLGLMFLGDGSPADGYQNNAHSSRRHLSGPRVRYRLLLSNCCCPSLRCSDESAARSIGDVTGNIAIEVRKLQRTIGVADHKREQVLASCSVGRAATAAIEAGV